MCFIHRIKSEICFYAIDFTSAACYSGGVCESVFFYGNLISICSHWPPIVNWFFFHSFDYCVFLSKFAYCYHSATRFCLFYVSSHCVFLYICLITLVKSNKQLEPLTKLIGLLLFDRKQYNFFPCLLYLERYRFYLIGVMVIFDRIHRFQ